MKTINKILFFFLASAYLIYAADTQQTDNNVTVDIPENGVTLSEEYPGNLAKPLYQPTFRVDKDVISGDQQVVTPPKSKRDFKSTSDAMKFGLKRGIVNLTLFWLEIPKTFSYEFTSRPLSAVATAPFISLGLGGARVIQGAIDLLSLGYTGYYSYGSMPDFPWEGKWVAKKTEKY